MDLEYARDLGSVRKGERLEENGIYGAEDRRRGADAESQYQNRRGRKARVLGQLPNGVTQVEQEG